MSDDVKALIAEARERFSYASGYVEMRELAIRLADALEAPSARPLVADREAMRLVAIMVSMLGGQVAVPMSLFEQVPEDVEVQWHDDLAAGIRYFRAAAYRTPASPTEGDDRG